MNSNFSFEFRINRFYSKASRKLYGLSRIPKYISEDKKCMLFKSFIILQFNYCQIVWMCFGRVLNNKINNAHERALRIVYHDKDFSFETLLKCDKFVSAHKKIRIYLAAKVVQVKNSVFQESQKKFLFF